MKLQSRLVTLAIQLTENEAPLLGSRAWVARTIEESTLAFIHTRQQEPAVFMIHPKGFGEEKKRTTQVMAIFGTQVYQPGSMTGVDPFPFYDACATGEQPTLFGITLTNAGLALASDFARKCKTLLRLRLRKDNAKPSGRLRVSIIS